MILSCNACRAVPSMHPSRSHSTVSSVDCYHTAARPSIARHPSVHFDSFIHSFILLEMTTFLNNFSSGIYNTINNTTNRATSVRQTLPIQIPLQPQITTQNATNYNILIHVLCHQVLESGAQTYAEVVQFCVARAVPISRILEMDLMRRLSYLRAG